MRKKAHRRGRSLKRGGRPRKSTGIPVQKIAKLAEIGCTIKQIASLCGVSRDTIERNYAEQIEKGGEVLNKRLRKKQIEIALKGKGDSRMLIWLGKQRLDQRDSLEITQTDDPLLELIGQFEARNKQLSTETKQPTAEEIAAATSELN